MTGATKRQRALRGHTPQTITTERKRDGGGVFAYRRGENVYHSIIIIFVQFHHFVHPIVTVRAVVSQPNEQRHSVSIYNDDTSEGV